jgi:hypothetical protein
MHLLVLVLVWVATSIIKINLWDGHLARLGIKTAAFLGEVAIFLF